MPTRARQRQQRSTRDNVNCPVAKQYITSRMFCCSSLTKKKQKQNNKKIFCFILFVSFYVCLFCFSYLKWHFFVAQDIPIDYVQYFWIRHSLGKDTQSVTHLQRTGSPSWESQETLPSFALHLQKRHQQVPGWKDLRNQWRKLQVCVCVYVYVYISIFTYIYIKNCMGQRTLQSERIDCEMSS